MTASNHEMVVLWKCNVYQQFRYQIKERCLNYNKMKKWRKKNIAGRTSKEQKSRHEKKRWNTLEIYMSELVFENMGKCEKNLVKYETNKNTYNICVVLKSFISFKISGKKKYCIPPINVYKFTFIKEIDTSKMLGCSCSSTLPKITLWPICLT